MATTHVFIVDATTFKYHLEYMFAGTGSGNKVIDFNNSRTTQLYSGRKHKGEDSLLGMIADSQRVRVGDYVIFYLQQNFQKGIREGKFYGVFKVKEAPSFLDNNDSNQFLKTDLGKSLTFRTIIEPQQVYSNGVTEWEALDEIKNIQSPNQMLWSLIYRKLKGNRGNTMITIYESERLTSLIRTKNNRNILQGKSFTFDENTQTILTLDHNNQYTGKKIPIELKSVNAYPDITTQLQRYVDWIKQYYLPNRPSDIEPMIVSREITDKTTSEYQNVINAFNQFDNRNNTLPLRYIEFSVDCNGQTITFNEIVY